MRVLSKMDVRVSEFWCRAAGHQNRSQVSFRMTKTSPGRTSNTNSRGTSLSLGIWVDGLAPTCGLLSFAGRYTAMGSGFWRLLNMWHWEGLLNGWTIWIPANLNLKPKDLHHHHKLAEDRRLCLETGSLNLPPEGLPT